MAATVAGALKAGIEAQGWALPCFRRRPPTDQPYPFCTIREGISTTVDPTGDQGDPAAGAVLRELVQLDVWQAARTPGGQVAEQYDLPARLVTWLRHARLVPVGTAHVYGVTGLSLVEVTDPDPAIIHHAVTCTVHRRA